MNYRSRAPVGLNSEWIVRARCASDPRPDRWYTEAGEFSREVRELQEICYRCPVRRECLRHAFEFPELTGIWGGMHHLMRARYRRKGVGFETAWLDSMTGRVA